MRIDFGDIKLGAEGINREDNNTPSSFFEIKKQFTVESGYDIKFTKSESIKNGSTLRTTIEYHIDSGKFTNELRGLIEKHFGDYIKGGKSWK